MTGHVNDHKLAALQSLLSISGGNIDDLEAAWLISEASVFGHVNDMWMNVFLANGASSLNYSDASYEFLAANGFANGGVTQRWHDYWLNGGGIGGFSPPDIAGLELWYDQSDLSTLWQDSGRTTAVTTPGDPVGAWDDKSVNGGHALQSTGAAKPTYQTTGIQFDGGEWLDNTLYVPADLFTTNTLYCVMRTSEISGTQCGFSAADNIGDIRYQSVSIIGTNGKGMFIVRNGPGSFAQTTSTGANDGANHVVTGSNVSDTSHKVWVDGAGLTDDTTNVGTALLALTSLGRISRANPVDFLTGYVMEAALYNTVHSAAEQAAWWGYAQTKWGTP